VYFKFDKFVFQNRQRAATCGTLLVIVKAAQTGFTTGFQDFAADVFHLGRTILRGGFFLV